MSEWERGACEKYCARRVERVNERGISDGRDAIVESRGVVGDQREQLFQRRLPTYGRIWLSRRLVKLALQRDWRE
jgi:hypothetical protein